MKHFLVTKLKRVSVCLINFKFNYFFVSKLSVTTHPELDDVSTIR